MFIAKFFMASSKEKKFKPINLIVWVPGRVEKMKKNIIFVLNKYQSVTHVSTCICQALFKNIVFRSVALVTKK